MDSELIGVLDVGKTHVRVLLVDSESGAVCSSQQRDSAAHQGGAYRELDVTGTEAWLRQCLASAPERDRIRHLVPIAHGAAAVLIDKSGRRLAALDYEESKVDEISAAYQRERDAFANTYSPALPMGLNLGRQWYYLQQQFPELWMQVDRALLYPQYWAWVLSGVAASELTSLGCHTDVWRPAPSGPSHLAHRHGWDRLLPPLHRAGDVLGTITREFAATTGLNPACRVYCGLHDSNASYLCHLAAQARAGEPFSVISSGTWTIALAQGAPLSNLRESLDMLANIDAFGNPVATARFMGGREYAQIAGAEHRDAVPNAQALMELLELEIMALPSFAPQGGPFAGRAGIVRHAKSITSPAVRVTLATVYMALMSEVLLEQLGAAGEVIVDGPLALNPLYAQLLQALRPEGAVRTSEHAHGAAAAARFLVTGVAPAHVRGASAPLPAEAQALRSYRDRWRAEIARAGSN